MPKKVMRRSASDNQYLHMDFHGALSAGIEYLDQRHGPEAVRAYLRRFADSYYAPLKEQIRARGLPALREHFEGVYALEGGEIDVEASQDELLIKVQSCPAVTHMRQHGYPVARLFHETTRTVNAALCEGTPFSAELLEYDHDSGRSVIRFWRRKP